MDRRDSTRFRVFIEGRSIEFQLSLVPYQADYLSHSGTLGGKDVVEDAQLFEKGKVDFSTFLSNDDIVMSGNLVLCLEDDKYVYNTQVFTIAYVLLARYITRQDGSPLMDALVLWRQAALDQGGAPQASSRAASPTPYSDTDDNALSGDESRPERPALGRSSTVGDEGKASTPKPSSSSWIRWWSRRTADSTNGRPELRPANSAPSEGEQRNAALLARAATLPPDSAPALPSTPSSLGRPAQAPAPAGATEPVKRYAKTLRLTSDQLVCSRPPGCAWRR